MPNQANVEAFVRELQPRLAELQRLGQNGGWYYDRERQVSWWSREQFRLFGLPPAEHGPTYEEFLERVHPDDRQRVAESYNTAIRLELELRHEFRVVRPDGVTIWIEGYSQPQRNAEGTVIRYEGTNQDITLRKLQEFEAREQSLQLRNAFDRLAEGVQVIDFNYRYQYLNDSALRHCRLDRGQLLGQPFIVPSGQADDEITRSTLRACMEQRQPKVMECVSDFCGRLPGLFNVSLQPVPEGVLILSSELSDSQRATEELRAKDDELNAFFDTSNVGMCECGFDGTILKANDAVCRMLGYEREGLLAVNPVQIVHEAERGYALEMLAHLSSGRLKNYQAVRRYLRRDGTSMHALIYASVNRRENEKPVSFVVVITDMSAQVKLEERLRQADKMQAIGRLAGGVAHDFNNLLTVIVGASKLIAEDELVPGVSREHAAAILEAGVRGAALTQQLLTYSRRQSPQMRPLEVNSTIASAELVLRRMVGAHLQIAIEFADRPLHVMADPVQFQQLIMNLVVNARDATSGEGTIRIRTALRSEYEWKIENQADFGRSKFSDAHTVGAIEISVADSGSGIAPDVLNRIYDPFFTTKEVGQGTGLGLAVVQGIIEECRGRIEVDTQVGIGTTMKLLFPISREFDQSRESMSIK